MHVTLEDRFWGLRGESGLRLAIVAAEAVVGAHRYQYSRLLTDDEALIDKCVQLARDISDGARDEQTLMTMTSVATQCRNLSKKRNRGCEQTRRRLRAWLAVEAARDLGFAASRMGDDKAIMAPAVIRIHHYLVVAKASTQPVMEELERIETDLSAN